MYLWWLSRWFSGLVVSSWLLYFWVWFGVIWDSCRLLVLVGYSGDLVRRFSGMLLFGLFWGAVFWCRLLVGLATSGGLVG